MTTARALLSVSACALLLAAGCGKSRNVSDADSSIAKRGSFAVTDTSEGEIKPMNELSMTSPTWGRLEWLHPNGEEVKKGEVVVRIESREQIKRAKDMARDLATLKREVEELEENLKIGRRTTALEIEKKEAELQVAKVKLRELLDSPTKEKLAEASADLKSSNAMTQADKDKRDELKLLFDKGFATAGEADAARIGSLVSDARGQLTALQFAKVEAGAEPSDVQRAKNAVSKAGISLFLARQNGNAKIKNLEDSLAWVKERHRRSERNIKRNENEIERRTMRAPRDGVVVHATHHRGHKIEEGSRVWHGIGIVNLPDLSVMKVRSSVSESQIRHLKLGDIVEVRVDPIPGEVFEAKVFWIDNWARDKNADLSDADRKTQGLSGLMVFDFEARILKSDPRLKLGFQAAVTVSLQRMNSVVTVNARAVRRDGGAPHVHVQGPDGLVKRVVELGPSSGGQVVVTKGLAAGESVLLR